MLADLVEVAAAVEALHPALDDEQRDALVAGLGIRAGDHDHEVGQDAVGDEGLLPGEDVVVTRVHGSGPDALQVGPRARLGHRDRRDRRTGAQPGEPPLRLLVVRARHEVGRDHVVEEREGAAVDAAARHLLADDGVVAEVRRPAPAVLLGELEAEQPLCAGLRPDLAVDDSVALPLLVEGHGLLVEEGPDRLAERLVLGIEDRAGHVDHCDSETVKVQRPSPGPAPGRARGTALHRIDEPRGCQRLPSTHAGSLTPGLDALHRGVVRGV